VGFGAGEGVGIPEISEKVGWRGVGCGEDDGNAQRLQRVEGNQTCDELVCHLVTEHRLATLIDLHPDVLGLDPAVAVVPAFALDGDVGTKAFDFAEQVGRAISLQAGYGGNRAESRRIDEHLIVRSVERKAMHNDFPLGDCGGFTDRLPYMTGPLGGGMDVQDIAFLFYADAGEGVALVEGATVPIGAFKNGKICITCSTFQGSEMVGVGSRLDHRSRTVLGERQLIGDVDFPGFELYRFAVVTEQGQNWLLMVAYGR